MLLAGDRRLRIITYEDTKNSLQILIYLLNGYLYRIWRPINGPVEDYPLALCNAFSVDESTDLVPGDRVTSQNVGEVYYIAFNSCQDWYWLSRQTPDEMTVFVSYDSSQGIGPACKNQVTAPFIRVKLIKQSYSTRYISLAISE